MQISNGHNINLLLQQHLDQYSAPEFLLLEQDLSQKDMSFDIYNL
jgi:hypothetical protein